MKKSMALLFAVIGTLLLASIAYFIAAREPWLLVLAILVNIGFLGFSFAYKARKRRQAEQAQS
ncbi:DUF5325 family protein [Paenibacillus sp. N1-5-1-14]|uniref:DUF5325 family protein n=1 Tax=Paenibacillus radicibacter TaxID=2972488 RepID=UPI0021591D21|nr:DUF5325 family protein [Paenibacillus radicibacter]MCR8645311.1 DUF5325 family protein [Paenibacillus radicibacter]